MKETKRLIEPLEIMMAAGIRLIINKDTPRSIAVGELKSPYTVPSYFIGPADEGSLTYRWENIGQGEYTLECLSVGEDSTSLFLTNGSKDIHFVFFKSREGLPEDMDYKLTPYKLTPGGDYIRRILETIPR